VQGENERLQTHISTVVTKHEETHRTATTVIQNMEDLQKLVDELKADKERLLARNSALEAATTDLRVLNAKYEGA
jgi:nitrogen fixation/metabolism regulation signal transduction histidine kinase